MSTGGLPQREALLHTLQSSKVARARAEAAFSLCELVDADNRELLAADVAHLVTDSQLEVRCAGLALAIQTLSTHDATDLLTRHLSDSAARVRVEAAGRLADLTMPELRGVLAAALEDADFRVRFEAARGIAALGHTAGLDVLLEGLEHTDFRFRAAEALTVLRSAAAKPGLQRAFSRWFLPAFERTQVAFALAQLGEAAGCEHLKKRCRPGWRVDRAMALEFLGASHCQGALALLSERAADVGDTCRGAAVRGLGRLGDPQAIAFLQSLLPTAPPFEDHWVLDLAEALHQLKDKSAPERLQALTLVDPDAQLELTQLLSHWNRESVE